MCDPRVEERGQELQKLAPDSEEGQVPNILCHTCKMRPYSLKLIDYVVYSVIHCAVGKARIDEY